MTADGEAGSGDRSGAGGSRARDHLANERTYLSWLRTALGVVALSVAVARFGPGEVQDTVAVLTLGALGALILGVGTYRFYQVSQDLERDRFRLSRRGPLLVALVVVVVALILVPLFM